MKTPSNFLYFDTASNEWAETSLDALAAANEPETHIVPVYEDGTQGPQTTWGEWQKKKREERVEAELTKSIEKQAPQKKSIFDYMLAEEVVADAPPPENKPKEKPLGELERIMALPPEVRAVDYLMRISELQSMISEATSFFKTATTFLTFVLVLNIIAIFIFLISLIVS